MIGYFDQQEYEVRFEWGLPGVEALAPVSDVVIIVDVLSFTTCVDIACGRGAAVFPYRGSLETLPAFAADRDAEFATKGRGHGGAYSLSPSSLLSIPKGTRLVLPSPNGSTLSLATGDVPTIAGCLRNARAVAKRAGALGQRISVIAAGERWPERGLLRPGIEDLLGAGAIISHLDGTRSPEAETVAAAFRAAKDNLLDILRGCGSGKELIGRGFETDVELAAKLNVSEAAPILVDRAYRVQSEDSERI